MSDREFDIIVWGATGFTGVLVAEYLLDRYGVGGDLRWAIAGRSADKLKALKSSLGDGAADLPSIVADSFDEEALDAMTSRTTVVLTTVGPYAKYGSPLVAACVKNGTHYCDLAGEAQWIRKMIDEHHDAAAETGAKIVHCCGFDSVPMDIGVWFLQREAVERHGEPCKSIRMLVAATRGGASGGTIASMLNLIEESRRNRDIARVLVHPYSLNPPDMRSGPDGRDQQNIRFDDQAKAWTAPFVMAGINTKVVRRSHALAGLPYGEDFRYAEAVMTGRGIGGWFKAAVVTVGLGALVTGASFKWSRNLLKRFVLPEPGEGPDREARENGFFNLRQYGRLADGSLIRGKITGDRDPGYGSTSKMLSEAAVCLAKDSLKSGGGVFTPAAAMAEPYHKRLTENAGLTFEILSD
ncbi:MAG: saccharopine dehydrogenase NADP-binding domain-containing protein [Woeseiaceae bacterium]|nr:saccharopine dehydrogenase NADP-binding domain-containing protein [Woeseiaceae bacterium]